MLKEIWAIRARLQIARRGRDLALFNLAIDSKLRACDLMQLRVRDVCHGQTMASRALVLQQKTRRPVQFAHSRRVTEVNCNAGRVVRARSTPAKMLSRVRLPIPCRVT